MLLRSLAFLTLFLASASLAQEAQEAREPEEDCQVATDAPEGLRRLVAAYPDVLCGATATELLWKDGTRMPYETRDRTTPMDEEDRLNSADLRDQMEQPYPAGKDAPPPQWGEDPGRYRCEAFFTKLYGDTQQTVAKNTIKTKWLDQKNIRFSALHTASDHLEAIKAELKRLPPKLRKIAEPTSGTFVWRKVKGKKTAKGNSTQRLSAHSYAVAIDIAVPHSDFWGWVKPDKEGRYPYKNRIPFEIVEIFEKHCFIWGGRWAHFDTMHFEYRPELLPQCL